MNRLAIRRAEARGTLQQLIGSDVAFSWNGHTYYPTPTLAMPNRKVDTPDGSFGALVEACHRQHDVISAAVVARGLLLSQLRFRWRSLIPSENGKLFGTSSLGVLEQPNESQTLSELLMLAESHVSYAGNAFFHRDGDTIRLLNPQWTAVVLGSNIDDREAASQLDTHVVGYWYTPGGPSKPETGVMLPASDVAHWRPEPDPVYWWRGVSWVQSVLTDWVIDKAARAHTQAFFEHAATPQMVFKFDPSVPTDQIRAYADAVERGHAGASNAYKSLFIGGGADAQVVGSDLKNIDLRSVTGLSETRIAVRSRMPATLLGVSEGLGGSALNAGNYNQTRRMLADGWFSPVSAGLCAALAKIVPPPAASELWWDPSAVMFVQDDRLDEAQIQQQEAMTIRQLVDAGFDPLSVVTAVTTGDFRSLNHSGLYSVQLQPAGSQQPSPGDAPNV